MGNFRSVLVFIVIGSLSAACSNAAPGATPTSQPTAGTSVVLPATQPAVATPAPALTPAPVITPAPIVPPTPTATQPPASEPASTGGTITYEITGEYEASGVATFDPEGSNYTEEGYLDIFREGWTAYFDNEAAGHNIRLVTREDDQIIEFFGGEVVVRGDGREGSDDECTFTIEKNDETGPVGSAVCERAVLHPNGSTYVTLSVEWDVNL